jgi:membrane-associated phospholipid phosphatase
MRPTERLTLAVLMALSAAFAATRPPGSGPWLALLASLAVALWGVARGGERRGAAGLLRDLVPVAGILVVYSVLQPLIEAANPARWDGALAALDARWFGKLAQGWQGLLGRPALLTDAAYLAYVSYYGLPFGVYVAAKWRDRRDGEVVGVTLVATFYLSYLGYLAVPASGPRVPHAEEALLGGGVVSEAIRAFLGAAELTTLDAFPSGHTALSLLAAALATSRFPRWAPALAAWAAAIIFSTVYIHVHYVSDLVAGVALAAIGLQLGPALHRWLGGEAAPRPAPAGGLPTGE